MSVVLKDSKMTRMGYVWEDDEWVCVEIWIIVEVEGTEITGNKMRCSLLFKCLTSMYEVQSKSF